MDFHNLTIQEASALLRKRQLSSVELTKSALERIEQIENKLHALTTITRNIALQQAQHADELLAKGESTPLTGIPVIIKDNICTSGVRTSCSSKMLENFIPPYNAHVFEKLTAQNTVMVGKSNMDEFAMGSSTEHSAFYPTQNPWDVNRVPGGSSGGSAAAVSAGEAIFALGSDTGGSIRQPAGFCSVVGFKPTYGRVSRCGLIAFASSLDQIGPLTKDVTDCALVMNAIAGHDGRDSTSVNLPIPDYTQALNKDIKGLRLGIPREYFVEGMEPGVDRMIKEAISKLEELGAEVSETSLPSSKYALSVYYIIAPSEASANLARYDGIKYGFSAQEADNMWDALEKTRQFGFGPEVKRRIMLGTHALSSGYYDAYYLKAQKVRTLIRQEFTESFKQFDALITPTSPTVPFKLGEKVEDPMKMYLSDVCTLPVNISGIPGISLPAGFADGLPVGLQILARPFAEDMLIRIAHTFEQATAWHLQNPSIS